MAKSKKTLDEILDKYGTSEKTKSFSSKSNNSPILTKPNNKATSTKSDKGKQSNSSASSLDDLLNKYDAKPNYTFSGKSSTTSKPNTTKKLTAFNTESKNAYTSVQDKLNSKTTISNGMTEEQRNKRIKEINSELNTLERKSSGYSRARAYSVGKAMAEAEQKDRDRIAELKKEKTSLERTGTFTGSEVLQWDIDDASKKVSSLQQKVASYGQRPSGTEIEGWRQANSELYQAIQELKGLERRKDLYDDITEFKSVVNNDDFGGQWRANYRSNELSREADKAMSRYIDNPTEENKEIAYAYGAFVKEYMKNNEKALDDENVQASWLTKSLAGYLPQFQDQIIPELVGGGVGAALGAYVGMADKGAAIGAGIGTGLQSYGVIRGSVYRTLLESGVDEETALNAAKDEALISSLIEGGGTVVSLLFAGGVKAFGAIGNAAKSSVAKGSTNVATRAIASMATKTATKATTKATTKAATKAVAEVSKPLWRKGLNLAGSVAIQGGTEYLEEFTQGAVSRANQERALSGTPINGKGQLVTGAREVIADAVTGKDPEALADLHSQGMEGFKIGVMLGGSNATVNNIVSHYANAKTVKLKNEVADTIIEDEESLNALIEEGKASGEGTVSAKIATEIETARENGKEVTREQVKQLIESNEVYIKAEGKNTPDPIEQTAREVVEERKSTPISVEDIKKTTGFGDSGAVLITKLMDDNGVSFESAKSAVETAYRVGLTGVDNRQVKFFNDTQRLAFEAGKNDKQVQDRAKQAQTQTASVYKTGFTENEHSAKLTSAEREMFSTFANDLKMDVRMTDKIIAYYVNGKAREANASHTNGKMEVSSTSELPMVAVAMHEGFHRMRQLDPVATDALMNFLYETSDQNVKRLKVGDTGVSNFERIKGEYSNVKGMEALDYIEEIACRRSETIFSNPEAYNEWRAKLEMNPQAKSAWQKLLDVIRKLLEDMWATITNSKMSLEAKRQAQTELELFADAYRGAMKAADTRLQAVEAQKKTEVQTETRSEVTQSPVASESKVENKETPTKPKNKPQAKSKAVKVGETYTAFSLKKADEKAPTFYSHMGKTIDGIKQDKIGANSVVSYLTGRGVKAEEIKWSGIETFLEGKKSVTKAELQEFVAGSMLQIETKTIKDDITIRYTQEELADLDRFGKLLDKAWVEANDIWNEAYGTDIPADIMGSDNATNAMVRYVIDQHGGIGKFEGISHLSDAEMKIYDAYGDNSIIRKIKDLEEAQAYIGERAKARRDNTKQTKYHKYTLDGGSGNYRELLFKLPNSEYTNDAMSMHWGEGGILAHARVLDFDVDGQKMLFIEEIQSDWHNEGAKKGYADKGKAKQREKFEALREKNKAERKSLIEELSKHYEGKVAIPEESAEKLLSNIANDKSNFNALIKRDGISDTLAERIVNYEIAKVEEALQLKESLKKGVEDAPFRNNYHEYVLKNLLRMAAEEGYDSIGWTTADVQSQRWSGNFAEGYRIEYDQDIPKFLNKYGKKWGAKVGKTEIGKVDGGWYEVEGTEVWSMPITDSMKNSVLYEGQPMFSLKAKDQEYLELAKDPKKNKAKLNKMVKEVAKEAGYTGTYYHGSKSDFTVFKKEFAGKSNSNASIGFWFTETEKGAKNWINNIWWGDNEKGKVYKTYLRLNNPKVYETLDTKAQRDELYKGYENIDKEMTLYDSIYYFDDGRRYHSERYDYDKSKRRHSGIAEWDAFKAIVRKFDADTINYYLDKVSESERDIVKQDAERYLELSKERKALEKQITELSYSDAYELFRTDMYKQIGLGAEDANIGGTGKYVENEEEMLKKYVDMLKQEGYDGIIIKGTAYDTDTFGENNNQYLVLDSNQVKSADSVTYDDNGNVIPLSERFNTKNDDIRYSLKDSEGKTLTKEQAEYFKGSKIRDKEGNLLVMYHGTTRGGFTVFDGGKDYWYFTNDKKYSYAFEGRKKNGQFYPYTKERMEKGEATPQRYKVYLNVKNPYIADIDTVEDALYWDRSLAGLLREKGFDALMVEDMSQVIVLNANQIKNTTNKNPSAVDDIRYSLKNGVDVSPQKTTDYLNAVEGVRKGKKGAAERLAKYVDEGMIRTEAYDALIEKYGVIPSGERPHRDIQVPRKSGKNKKVSQTVRTILEAKATPDEAVPTIEKMVEDGIFSYDVYTDKQALSDAEEYIKSYGWDESLDDWFDAVNKGEVSKELTTMGWALYNNAANIAATTTSETERTTAIKTSLKILDAMVRHQRSAAQALQATRILKKLSPETQLYGVQKSVQAFQNELAEKYGDKAPDLTIDEELAEQFLTAETEEERAEIEKEIYKDIGRQMPSRFIDKWNAWRYLAMLGNLRTHIRNIFGNAFFAPVVATKNLTATAIESAVYRVSGKKTVRGKSLVWGSKTDRALLKAAWSDYGNVADLVSNGGKYNDSAMANQHIQEGRQIFKFKPLEWARKGNSKLLETEDMWFSQPHYAYALAQYCKANNITPEQISRGKAIAPARDYAIKEAQKATYRDTNAFSQMVSEWGRGNRNEKNVVKKAFNTVIEGILPFRKTPANILVRGVEYSPLGLLKGLSYDLVQVGKGKMTATEAIDNISAGLTGSGLLALGVYLAAQGLIRGHGEDEEEKEFKELMGHQSYSLELPNGQSITLDWLAPEALPFFIGVNIWEATKGSDEEVTLSTILQSISHITEPMLEMSCLQGLNDLFEGIGYASSNDTSALVSVLSSAATSYLMQGIPTLSGQAERTGEEERMTTYTEKNDFLTGDMQYTLGKASAKIPYWDYNQIPYIDAWGRKEASGTALKRGLNNFLNPAYTSTIETSKMEEELLRLYEKTGEGGVFPARADKYFMIDGERKDLTAEEYVRYATLKGEKSYKLVSELVESKEYKKLSNEEKVEAVKDAYDYANQKAKESISNYKPDKWVKTMDEFGTNSENFILFRTNVSATREANGDKIEKEQVVDIISDIAQNDSEAWNMYLSMYDGKTALEAEKHGINAELFMTAVVDMGSIKADYKSNGKVISGSRRKKIENYLNSVCTSYKEYLFLLGTEYDSIKDDHDYVQYFGKEEE